MSKRLKMSALAFVAAVAASTVTAPRAQGNQEAFAGCHAKPCTVDGNPGVCCLLFDGSINCDPCGAVE